MIEFHAEGFEAMAKDLRNVGSMIEEETVKTMQRILVDAQEEARMRAPIKRGGLRRSIDKRITVAQGPDVVGVVGSDLPYARITELGGTIRPKGKGFLSWYDPKSRYAAKSGKWKGWVFTRKPVYHPAQPYLFPTLVAGISKWLKEYDSMWKEIERKATKK